MISYSAFIKFHGYLNDFLRSVKRNKFCHIMVSGHQTIKDIIESMGIPHVEVDVILVNKSSVNFKYRIRERDRAEVYGSGNKVRRKNLYHLQVVPLKYPRFILDEHLGKLASKLRMIGIDSCLFNGKTDKDLVEQALRKRRIILTRDVELLKRSIIKRGYWVRNDDPAKQVTEIYNRFHLEKVLKPFHRCLVCNGLIIKVNKEEVAAQIPPGSRSRFDEYFRCSSCGKIYWKGSHYEKMKFEIENIIHY